MSTNKHAIIRYQALDKCFANQYRRYSIDDLVEACNEAIYRYTGITEGVRKRQVYDDIAFMQSEQGYCVPLEKTRDGRHVFYSYSEKGYSINNQPLTDSEINQLKEVTFMLSRFKGMPSFEWIDEIITHLEDKFHLVGNTASVISFEQNQYLKGLEYFSDIFNSIVNRQCLTIRYHSFKGKELIWDIHPYYLKQYNTRWFLLGLNNQTKSITNIPLDRIQSIEMSTVAFIPHEIDFDEYFDDIVGVTIPKDRELERVRMRFSESRYPYIISKPIHPSQKIIDGSQHIIEIEVIPNKELTALLLSYGKDVEIIAPEDIRNEIRDILASAMKNYSTCADTLH